MATVEQSEMFLQLIMQFQSAALIQLGEVKNPQTDRFEKNLKQAQYFINMLDMIQQKTIGNLTDEENKILENTLATLKVIFVNRSSGEDKGASGDETDPSAGNGQPEPESGL